MRLRREKGERKKGALQATQDPNVPNNNTGIILSIIPVLEGVLKKMCQQEPKKIIFCGTRKPTYCP